MNNPISRVDILGLQTPGLSPAEQQAAIEGILAGKVLAEMAAADSALTATTATVATTATTTTATVTIGGVVLETTAGITAAGYGAVTIVGVISGGVTYYIIKDTKLAYVPGYKIHDLAQRIKGLITGESTRNRRCCDCTTAALNVRLRMLELNSGWDDLPIEKWAFPDHISAAEHQFARGLGEHLAEMRRFNPDAPSSGANHLHEVRNNMCGGLRNAMRRLLECIIQCPEAPKWQHKQLTKAQGLQQRCRKIGADMGLK